MPSDSLPKIHIPFEMLLYATYNIHSSRKILIKRMGTMPLDSLLKNQFPTDFA